MSLDADSIVDRRRMRRKLTFWRVFAVLVAIGAVIAIGVALRAPGTGMLTADRRFDRPRHHYGPDPRRPGARRGAGAAGQVARAGRDRAHQQPRRHHLRLGATVRRADAAEGAEAAGGRGRRACGVGRLHRRDRRRPHRRAGDLAGRLDRRAVPVSERHRSAEDARRQGRGDQIVAAQGGAERLRADLAGGARGDRGDRLGFLRLVPRPGEGPPPARRRGAERVADGRVFTGRQGVGAQARRRTRRRARPRSPGSRRKRTSIPKTPVRDYRLRDRLSDLPFLHTAAVTVLDAVGLGAFARRIEEWGALQAIERLNLDGLLALWHPSPRTDAARRESAPTAKARRDGSR